MDYIEQENKLLIEKGYDSESIENLRKSIKTVSKEDADELGHDILEILKIYVEPECKLNDIENLILNGANLEYIDPVYGNTLLIKATKLGSYKIFSMLAKYGANLNAKSKLTRNNKSVHHTTATMWSSWFGHINILEDLILLGADVNAMRSNGDTALILAPKNNQIESAKRLIAAGAILTIRNNQGKTALDIAKEKKYNELVDLLQSSIQIDNKQLKEKKEPIKLVTQATTTQTIADELNAVKKELLSLSTYFDIPKGTVHTKK